MRHRLSYSSKSFKLLYLCIWYIHMQSFLKFCKSNRSSGNINHSDLQFHTCQKAWNLQGCLRGCLTLVKACHRTRISFLRLVQVHRRNWHDQQCSLGFQLAQQTSTMFLVSDQRKKSLVYQLPGLLFQFELASHIRQAHQNWSRRTGLFAGLGQVWSVCESTCCLCYYRAIRRSQRRRACMLAPT